MMKLIIFNKCDQIKRNEMVEHVGYMGDMRNILKTLDQNLYGRRPLTAAAYR
jgi:hypothetical protein